MDTASQEAIGISSEPKSELLRYEADVFAYDVTFPEDLVGKERGSLSASKAIAWEAVRLSAAPYAYVVPPPGGIHKRNGSPIADSEVNVWEDKPKVLQALCKPRMLGEDEIYQGGVMKSVGRSVDESKEVRDPSRSPLS